MGKGDALGTFAIPPVARGLGRARDGRGQVFVGRGGCQCILIARAAADEGGRWGYACEDGVGGGRCRGVVRRVSIDAFYVVESIADYGVEGTESGKGHSSADGVCAVPIAEEDFDLAVGDNEEQRQGGRGRGEGLGADRKWGSNVSADMGLCCGVIFMKGG